MGHGKPYDSARATNLTRALQVERCIRVVEGVQQAVIGLNGKPVPEGMSSNIESLVA